MEDENVVEYRWVVLWAGSGEFKGAVFTDSIDACNYINVSYSTFRRKYKNEIIFTINNYKVIRLPYYKSKRGGK